MANTPLKVITFVLFIVITWSFTAPARATPKILASIKPLALIAQEVAGDAADVQTLLPIAASPHDYPLKVSDHRRLRSADVILWIGPELESFLARPLAALPASTLMTVYELNGIHWPTANDHQDHESHRHANHRHTANDPHLWLDPRNAEVIAIALAERLAGLNPEAASTYQLNAARFIQRVKALDGALEGQLASIKRHGFAVYHEGYSHFVGRYGLHQIGYVTYAPERRPGARHLKELEDVLAKEGKCLFIEPYYEAKSIETMAQSLGLRIGVLDPIGGQQISSYIQLMEALGNSFLTCLADSASP